MRLKQKAMTGCFFCSHEEPHPEMIVLHIICRHLKSIKKKLHRLVDINASKLTDDPGIVDLISQNDNSNGIDIDKHFYGEEGEISTVDPDDIAGMH